MSIARSISFGFLCFTVACGSGLDNTKSLATSAWAPRGGQTEFTLTSFDGERLRGRLLIGATIDSFQLDGRLIEWVDVELRDIRVCNTKDLIEHYLPDFNVAPIQADDVITLRPNAWYGKKVSFLLFSRRVQKTLPSCFEADLWVWSLDRQVIVKQPVRIQRTDQSPIPSTSPSAPPAP